MSNASTLGGMSPGLLKVVERAQREPEGRFHSLAHLIDVPALRRAYDRQRKSAAVGVDGMTKEQYGRDLEVRLQDLHERLRSKRYRHQPIRRVHIPKGQGKTRPIGISAFEDKLVQDVLREVVEAIYEQDFLDCSYGFRPGRGAHDAVRTLNRIVGRGEVNWILEADIVSFFDSVDRTALIEMLQTRVGDVAIQGVGRYPWLAHTRRERPVPCRRHFRGFHGRRVRVRPHADRSLSAGERCHAFFGQRGRPSPESSRKRSPVTRFFPAPTPYNSKP